MIHPMCDFKPRPGDSRLTNPDGLAGMSEPKQPTGWWRPGDDLDQAGRRSLWVGRAAPMPWLEALLEQPSRGIADLWITCRRRMVSDLGW
jgi:hypothetical protein